MPRTCLARASSERREIDKAVATGEPLRNIAKHVSMSPAGLLPQIPRVSDNREDAGAARTEARAQHFRRNKAHLTGSKELENAKTASLVVHPRNLTPAPVGTVLRFLPQENLGIPELRSDWQCRSCRP